ncbi:hypothetical protein [Halovulum sp. GXIMD14793]
MKTRVLLICAAFSLVACDETATNGAAKPADPAEPVVAASGDIAPPATLTANERKNIWSFLTDAAKRDAIAFIKNGGTLTQFVNS